MIRFGRALGFFLILTLVSAGNRLHAFDEIADAQKEIIALAKEVEAGKDVTAKAAEIKKKVEELATIMAAYKPKNRKGLGVGTGTEGIESKLIALGKRANAATLEKEKDALIQMAFHNIALGEITLHYAPDKPRGGKGKSDWDKHTKEMITATKEFLDAVRAGNAAKVKSSANNVNNACNNCHSDFRD